jgi:ABC-type Zn uptake system ZnuABC Zn-binding protein ZnuA
LSVKKTGAWLVLGVFALLAAGCGGTSGEEGGGAAGSEERMRVSATITVVGDLVEEVGGDRVEVSSVAPPGADVHTFQPKPSDVQKLSESEVIFQSGQGLELWLDDLIQSAGNEDATVVELSEGLEPIGAEEHGEEHGEHAEEGAHEEESHGEEEHAGDEGAHEEHAGEHGEEEPAEEGEHGHEHTEGNPHFWLDVENAEHYVENIRDALIEADPEGEDTYRDNAREYLAELEELDAYITEQAGTIPEERRNLVTFHDAFPYFAEAYGFELVGVIVQNPEAEPSSREVAELVREIEEQEVPAVFAEPQFNAGLAETIADEAGVEVKTLYSDALVGNEGADSYESMMRTNIDNVVEGLG